MLRRQAQVTRSLGCVRLMINLMRNQHILRKQQCYRQQDGVLFSDVHGCTSVARGRMPGAADQK